MSKEIEDTEYEDSEVESAEFDADVFDSMVNGTFEEEDDSVEEDAEAEIPEDEDVFEDDEHQEDTDLEDDEDVDEDLDEAGDGELDEDLAVDEDLEGEDSLVEADDLDDDDDDIEVEDEVADEATETATETATDDVVESEDGEDTEEKSDGDAPATSTIDYKAFYDAVVNTEFTVNGRKSKGFADPKKIIQSMQMAGGFSEKMAGFKKYRPFMAPLQERGMLEDQAKFDLAMNIIDGDPEAIKQHLQSMSIDPVEFDMESINYSNRAVASTPESLVIDDSIERAKRGGYEDSFRKAIGTEWDAESFGEFVKDPQVRADLLDHMESGAYERVQDKMAEMGRLDVSGAYGTMPTISKYRAAVKQLQAEAPQAPAAATTVPETPQVKTPVQKKPSVKDEAAKITKQRDEASYKRKVAVRNSKAAEQRKRAASMSKKKPKAKPAAKFDPMTLEGADFDAHFESLISGGRG